MPKSKKTHPADAANEEIIANAVSYRIALFLGRGEYAKAEAETLQAAFEAAGALEIEHHHVAAKAIIYAVDGEGREAVFSGVAAAAPAEVEDLPALPATYSVKSAAVRAARAALGAQAVAGEDFDVRQDGAGRFRWVRLDVAKQTGGPAIEPQAAEAEPIDLPNPLAPAKVEKPAKRQRDRLAQAGADRQAERAARRAKPEAKPAAEAKRVSGKALMAAAAEGNLPAPPDFSAETHRRFRPKLDQLVALVEARDVAGLRAFEINPISSSPKAMARYRDAAVAAIEAQA